MKTIVQEIILNFLILRILGFLENQYSILEPLPLFSVNNHHASSKYWWSSLICISATSPGKSYSVLKSARVKHLRELYWLNIHFWTPNNIKFLHTPEKIKCFEIFSITVWTFFQYMSGIDFFLQNIRAFQLQIQLSKCFHSAASKPL